MLSFITFKDAINQVEIVADEKGIDDLIDYLKFIKKSKDHMHLLIDTELNAIEISGDRIGQTHYAKHVRLEFLPTDKWEQERIGKSEQSATE